jgi:hypothetical protein
MLTGDARRRGSLMRGPFPTRLEEKMAILMIPRVRWFPVALAVTAIGLAACGDDDGNKSGTTTGAEETGTTAAGGDETGTSAKESGEPILIKTQLAPLNARGETTGEVRSGSTIGDSAFCAGGKFLDGPVKPPDRSLVRSFRCPGGTLTITFNSTPPDVKQRSDWEIVKGLGRFDGLSGGGRMKAVSESKAGEGRETFTGTVTR